jgi:hypothetical protein
MKKGEKVLIVEDEEVIRKISASAPYPPLMGKGPRA